MRKLLFAVALGFCASQAAAGEALTWEQCVQIARQNNPDLQSAQKSAESRRALYFGSYSGYTPKVNLASSYNDGMNATAESRWQANGQASIDLFDPSRSANVQSTRAGRDEAEANLKLVSSNLYFNLRSAFAQVLFSQNQVAVSRRIRDIRTRNSELVSLRYNSGRESRGNMMRAKAELLEAETDINQSERDLSAARQELGRQMGQEEFSAPAASGTLVASAAPSFSEADWDAAVTHHPTVQVQQSELALARADVKQSRSVYWPTLSANYTRSFHGAEYFPSNPSWIAQGVVSYPLFGGGATAGFYSVASAHRNLERSEADLRAARFQVRSDLKGASASLAGANDQVKVQSAFLEAARQRNGEADIRYSSGLMTYENWEQIVTDRVNFERSLIRAQRDAVIAEAQWVKSMGKELGE